MPSENELDIELPAIWINQALTAPDLLWLQGGGWRQKDWDEVTASSARLVATFRDRLYSDVGVPNNPMFPHVVWDGRTDKSGCVQFEMPREFTARKRSIYRVRRVDKFDTGGGSWSPGRSTYNDLRRCLCGIGKTPIRVGGVLLGNIVQAKWRDDFRTQYRSSNTEDLLTELGFYVEITYENNG